MKGNEEKRIFRKRIIGILSIAVLIAVIGVITYFAIYKFMQIGKTPQEFVTFIEGYGIWGYLVALGIQFLQVFVALIPGEFVEVGMGLAFGFIEGTLLCLLGVAVASSLVFLLVKRFGVKLVELFVDPAKINDLRFINSEKKLNTLVFLLFLIPGTPKDLLTYVVPLTRMKLGEFLCITMIARIPSVVSSTIGGDFFGNGKYLEGIILFAVTGAVSLAGIWLYNVILKKRQAKKSAEADDEKE